MFGKTKIHKSIFQTTKSVLRTMIKAVRSLMLTMNLGGFDQELVNTDTNVDVNIDNIQ